MAANKDCKHYNKNICNCRILKELYCKKEDKPCKWYEPNIVNKEIGNVRSGSKVR